jgi:hypothetical protein
MFFRTLGLDDKVKLFVLHVEPITDMIDRSLKADTQDGNQTAVVSNRKL